MTPKHVSLLDRILGRDWIAQMGNADQPRWPKGDSRGGQWRAKTETITRDNKITKSQPYDIPLAKTRAEAEKTALQFTQKVSYQGMTLNEMNTANRVLAETLYAGKMPKIKEVYTVSEWENGIAGEGVIGLGLRALRAHSEVDATTHSMAYFNNQTEALIRHEVGHLIAQQHEGDLQRLLPYRPDWEKAYGVTSRARDWYDECLAENFSLYSIGRIELLHPAVINAFEHITRYQWR